MRHFRSAIPLILACKNPLCPDSQIERRTKIPQRYVHVSRRSRLPLPASPRKLRTFTMMVMCTRCVGREVIIWYLTRWVPKAGQLNLLNRRATGSFVNLLAVKFAESSLCDGVLTARWKERERVRTYWMAICSN